MAAVVVYVNVNVCGGEKASFLPLFTPLLPPPHFFLIFLPSCPLRGEELVLLYLDRHWPIGKGTKLREESQRGGKHQPMGQNNILLLMHTYSFIHSTHFHLVPSFTLEYCIPSFIVEFSRFFLIGYMYVCIINNC
jgi:hypothetical protein